MSFEKSVSFSDEPPDMSSPKAHSPQHSGTHTNYCNVITQPRCKLQLLVACCVVISEGLLKYEVYPIQIVKHYMLLVVVVVNI